MTTGKISFYASEEQMNHHDESDVIITGSKESGGFYYMSIRARNEDGALIALTLDVEEAKAMQAELTAFLENQQRHSK